MCHSVRRHIYVKQFIEWYESVNWPMVYG
jgi:hypothetical protein